MLSRETRVYLIGLGLAVALAIVAGPILGVGLDTSAGVLVGFLFFPGLSFLLPQLYLAATGDETEAVPPSTRVRVSLLLSGLIAVWLYSVAGASTGRQPLLGPIGVVLLGSLCCYEALLGYRSSSLFDTEK